MRTTGVTARGIVTPVFRQGDDLISAVTESVCAAAREEGFALHDRDIVAVTEAVVARTQGNYATCDQIAKDIRTKLGEGPIGILFPIMSRNRFGILLRAMAMASPEGVVVQLSFPSDEVGNALVGWDAMDEKGVDPYRDSFDYEGFRKVFGNDTVHPFTGMDYIEYYRSFAPHVQVVFSNDPSYILNYTKKVIACDIHTRARTKRILKSKGAQVLGMDDILTAPVDGSGFNPSYGILGSNKATEDKVKLFPRDCDAFVHQLQKALLDATGKRMEVMVYGDGCFKDPVGGIWELADPVVSPAHTEGLVGTPSELKMKYFADNDLSHLSGAELAQAMRERIRQKDADLKGQMAAQGTTPRRYTDLLGSLCDLTSGSGDRGTPVVLIQGYFTNFATE
ncbi:MAG: coenzyme F420-0:L-glutamate ligase [Clostridia bacterium]|nr:coenzyme F420-0:L-glutamate ligase [Clostridia bacterium]